MKHLISKAVRLEIRRTDFISAQLNQPVLIVVKHQLPKYHQAVNCSGRGTAFILKTHRDEFYSLLKIIFFPAQNISFLLLLMLQRLHILSATTMMNLESFFSVVIVFITPNFSPNFNFGKCIT